MSATTQAFQMWDRLMTVINAELGAGHKLAGIVDVRKGAQFAAEQVPAIAVQLMNVTTSDYAMRTKWIKAEFMLVVAVSSVGTDSRVPNLDDAMNSLRSLVDDGNGNGLVPVLSANFGLGGTALTSSLQDVNFKWDVNEGAQQAVWAYCELRYIAENELPF